MINQDEIMPRKEAKLIRTVLLIIAIISIIFGIFKFFGSVALAVNEIITGVVLIFGAVLYSYNLVVFYVILTFLTMIQYVWTFGRMIQIHIYTGISPLFYELYSTIFLMSIILTFIFDLFAVYYSFVAYKEYKYIKYKKDKGVVDADTKLLEFD